MRTALNEVVTLRLFPVAPSLLKPELIFILLRGVFWWRAYIPHLFYSP